MSDADQGVRDVAVFQLAQVEAELDTLWRVMFGAEPRPANPRRALARCWAKAMHVDWGHTPKQPILPLGLVRDDEE